ncbi:hypothetical protein A3A68_01435 [Candidatus Saccharibacteria bacterium RIFCSPLOWO2_01_FULL_48_13]|nr:MAG: hypothetical protein A2884_00280 [Candidatus Saccharibacteria bacterium RIFCSPHIGHO2_01_FULL_48_12]OGL36797.1 MAG: hypothetical protein A3F38_02615 [Candidatus Saccharibacteria bacterium RIFCSPHIGHO2_12_FULL_48_21]OGL37376.1 MAG: hypothetical protein A3A68_01435 [Candidatus Saccharibacteria bacterium RIFCSPLOWO2_01_FULL_48_13]
MAKNNKKVSDWAIIFVLVLLILATNLYWMLVTNEQTNRLDAQTTAILQLQDCYNSGTVPCE